MEKIVHKLSKDLYFLGAIEDSRRVDEKMLDKISNTLYAMQSQRLPEKSGNAANILQSLQEKVEEIRKKQSDVRPKERKHKVTRFEIVQFLNSTEKQLQHAITLIRERDADEEQLLAFIEELKKQLEEMKLARAFNLKSKKIHLGERKEALAELVEELLRSEPYLSSDQRELFIKTLKLFKKELFAFLS